MTHASIHRLDVATLYRRIMTQKGRAYELTLCSDIYNASHHELFPEPIGYSGNHNVPAPDIKIDDGTKIHAIELKNTEADRVSILYDPDDRGTDDIDQLLTYAHEYPRTVVPYIGVKFNNRQLILCPLWLDAPNDIAAMRSATKMTPCDIRLTASNNLSIHKPSTDVWPSARSSDDAEYVLDAINYA